MFPAIDYKPRFPDEAKRPAIGIIGCGGIVRAAHLPAYAKHKLPIAGVYDPDPKATAEAKEKFGVEPAESVESLLQDPQVGVIDVATHPDVRVGYIKRALEAGKHVLAQKPLALDVASARECVQLAKAKGLRLAVNQNGRWSPAFRIATKLVQDGAVGDVIAVTHLYEINYAWTVGTWFEKTIHPIVYDYSIHWIDITRCWMEGKRIEGARARTFRLPHQKEGSVIPHGANVEFDYADGASAMIRIVGAANTKKNGHQFLIHGTKGNVRGSCLGNDWIEFEDAATGNVTRFQLEGSWFPDGFAGTMAELMSSIVENREPYNAAAHNLLSLQMTLAACESIDKGGAAVRMEEVTP